MQTPLYDAHVALGAKMVDFAGWQMPVQYTSIIEEHMAVRERAGLFDVSHMGELSVQGKNAQQALNRLVSNDITKLQASKAMYTFLTNERGGVVDDLLVYKMDDTHYFLVVNASNTDKDFQWLSEKTKGLDGVTVVNQSASYGQIALQGPLAQQILQTVTPFALSQIGFFAHAYVVVLDTPVMLSRTGYTGEDGFEIYFRDTEALSLWNGLLAAGKDFGIQPVGLGARDTLRLESALPLYGHELSELITPLEAGLSYFVKLKKEDFTGLDALQAQKQDGVPRTLVGLSLLGKGIPRSGYRVEKDGADIGLVTSGTHSPTFKKGLAMALVASGSVALGEPVDIMIRDKPVKAEVVKLPFYQKKTVKNMD